MTSASGTSSLQNSSLHKQTDKRSAVLTWWPAGLIVLVWLALFGPAYIDFADYAWKQPENGHTPFLAAIILAGFFLGLQRLAGADGEAAPGPASPAARAGGLGVLAMALIILPIAQRAGVDLVLSGLQPVIASALVLAIWGVRGIRMFWFPLLLSLYLIIWPGWLLDALTLPLKMWLSRTAADLLYLAGLPVSHAGAIIHAGPYQLLVAQACAGLNALIALTAVGAVYLKIVNRQSLAANLAVIACLVPIAVIANAVRIILLILITLYLGYDAGQGFLHETAGLITFTVALGLVFMIDTLAALIFRTPAHLSLAGEGRSEHKPGGAGHRLVPAAGKPFFILALALMALSAGVSLVLEQTRHGAGAAAIAGTSDSAPDIAAMMPEAFGVWARVPSAAIVLPPENDLKPGEAVSYLAYRDDLGRIVSVVIAYGPPLSDNVRVHRPETCYIAHGFTVEGRSVAPLAIDGRAIPSVNLNTRRGNLTEAVTYWLRDGDGFTTTPAEGQWRNLLTHRNGRDSALVRVSSRHGINPDYALHRDFLIAFTASLPEDARLLLIGKGGA